MAGRGLRSFFKDGLAVLAVFAVLAVLVFPFVWIVLTSLRPSEELFAESFRLVTETVTLANFRDLLQSGFGRFILNSILVVVPATIITVLVALLSAYSFSRRTFRWRGLLLIVVVFSQVFPFVILVTPMYFIFYQLGLVNTYVGLIIAYVAITTPFSVYMLLGYLDTVPRQLDEAAIIDGCSTIGVIFRVVFPVAWPGIAATAIYIFAQAWNEFLFALTLMTRSELKTIPVGLANFFGQYTTQWELVMAASVLATLPTFVFFLFMQRHLVAGLAAGAVKQ